MAGKVPCVWAGNFSVGVNLLFHLTQRAARILDDGYDAEVVEMHHRFKKDAPSGTAARLLEIILQERKLTAAALRHGRNGITGERSSREVGIHSLRGGDVVGDHTVIFAALGERLELTHKASDRAIFARGALRAAQWVVAHRRVSTTCRMCWVCGTEPDDHQHPGDTGHGFAAARGRGAQRPRLRGVHPDDHARRSCRRRAPRCGCTRTWFIARTPRHSMVSRRLPSAISSAC